MKAQILAMAIQMLQTKRMSKGLSGWTYADATRTEGADWGRGIDAGMVSYEWCLVAAVILLCHPPAAAPRYEIQRYLSCSQLVFCFCSIDRSCIQCVQGKLNLTSECWKNGHVRGGMEWNWWGWVWGCTGVNTGTYRRGMEGKSSMTLWDM
jgi:hypothetical protein